MLPVTTVSPAAWTVLSMLGWAEKYLARRSFDECRLNAELLMAHVLDVPRLSLYVQFNRPLTDEELALFKRLFRRRLAHEPLQYILGETPFMGMSFEVDRTVLIPRPETENLVEEALTYLKGNGGCARILEIGTGSGNIAVTLAKFLPDAQILSIDVSPEALEVARRNALRHGVANVEFVRGDIFREDFGSLPFDAVVSNPPYVTAADFSCLQPEVRDFEPRIATTDGGDGLSFIRRIVDVSAGALRPGGMMFVEIGHDQAGDAAAIACAAGLTGVTVVKDFAGLPRILRGSPAAGVSGL